VTLRTRLVIGLAMVGVVLGLVVFLVPRTVERAQISEVDRQLRGLAPQATQQFGGPSSLPVAPDESFSDLYIAFVHRSGSKSVFVHAQLASSRSPAIPPGPASTELTVTTVRSADGAPGRWRAATVAGPERGSALLVAAPLDRVESTTGNVRRALLAGVGAVLAMLVVIGWWVIRLGLRPIAEVTQVADAIAGGQRDRRAESYAGNTEANQLAREVNAMLDRVVAVEDRLRTFVSDASHELRTPVTAIKGFTDLYRNGDLADRGELDEAMRRIGQESRRMEALVDDLLLLARLDEERPLERSGVDLAPLIDDAVLDAAATHPSRSVAADCERGIVVPGDESHLRQVLANLVRNALVHGGPGATVTVSAYSRPGVVVVDVCDDGAGMDVTAAAHAFDRFWRSDAGRVRSHAGAGLGLPIVRAIVEAHGGRVTLDTGPGSGTRVRVALPLAS
jgi:two-component system OmpR family sensor kinase